MQSLNDQNSSSAPTKYSHSPDEEALKECIEANVEGSITITKANNEEKMWWIDGNYKVINAAR